ncbi:MAG TPA: carboxypeptidase regulatory-like domain-containing protein [Terriglobales bacterium]
MKRLQFCLVVFAVVALTLSATAQVQFSQFTGTVLDPTGAAIANAKVTVANPATDLRLTATTNASGNYTVREVPPGVYKITVEAAGFKTTSNNGVTANAGTIEHVDFKLLIGKASEVIEVTGEASAINTEDSKLSTIIGSAQISNLPLNGRNVYDLMQLAPGAVNVMGVDFENGHDTVVNGVREDFNGFLINGVSNKDMSGGQNNVPIQDTVAEFQQLTLNMSAQYGSSAGSINNLVTKSGTNSLHGSVWEYVRNTDFDANYYFLNQNGTPRIPLHFNQFGGTLGGPIIKDKLFFFGSYQGDRFVTAGSPITITVESPQWRSAVEAAAAAGGVDQNSTAAFLYKNFAPAVVGTEATNCGTLANPHAGNAPCSVDGYVLTHAGVGVAGTPNYTGWLCNLPAVIPILGVTSADVANAAGTCPLTVTPAVTPGVRSNPFINNSVAVFGSQTQSLGNLFNGNEAMGRLDYNWNANNRLFVEMNWDHNTDKFGGNNCNANCTRGFTNPNNDYFPHASLSFVHTFSPTILNELKLGYTQNNTQITSNIPGVPQVNFNDGTAGIGSYNGYPQYFKDHEYSYGDMVSISHGNHSFKMGVDVRRNLENSLFSVARGSYTFNDAIYFAGNTPGAEFVGVNPDFCTTLSCSTINPNAQSELSPSIRHWRNWEVGAYFQDDWKATKQLTLNLGLRWDFYQRHTEEDNQVTTFILGPGESSLPGIAGQVASANAPFGSSGCPTTINPNTQILAGVCGPGGFSKAGSLGPNEYKDFGPRVGFAYDVFGDGKTSVRGGFGISYEGTLYNPLSNSRWNPPYYSFNEVGPLVGVPGTIIWGPTTCTGSGPTYTCTPNTSVAPSYTGPATNPGQGSGAQAVGNLGGWDYTNKDSAFLTGIVTPQGIKDPYVYNFFFGIQREIVPKWVVEANYVGTAGHRLFRAQQINRAVGGGLPEGASLTNNIGETVSSLIKQFNSAGVPNPNYGVLRDWENANNSNYSGLQLSLRKQMSHGMLVNANYTYSHSIDNGSSWHDAATTAAGASAGDGYSTDNTDPGLDRGNSIFDIRHRLSLNYVYNLPGQNLHGVEGAIIGGWTLNGIWSFQSGAHWSPYSRNTGANLINSSTGAACVAADVTAGDCINVGGEWTLDGQFPGVTRPDTSVQHFNVPRSAWKNGWPSYSFFNGSTPGSYSAPGFPSLSAPCLACIGNLGRNTFTGPGQWSSDMTLGKNFKITERFNLKFEASAFNIFNRANFLLATAGGGANNSLDSGQFGKAGGTLDPRALQLGLKLLF